VILVLLGCAEELNDCEGWDAPEVVGTVESELVDELSGIALSAAQPDWMWVHNDSGDTSRVFAMGTDGSDGGRWVLAGIELEDAEDIALADGQLILGDIGDNKRKREAVFLHVFDEPEVTAGGGTLTEIETRTLRYPNGAEDAEALVVDEDGTIWLFTKGASSIVYRVEGEELVEAGEIDPRRWRLDDRTQVTGADLIEGKLVVRMYDHILVWNVDSAGVGSTVDGTACSIPVAYEPQGEALGGGPGGFYTASEGEGAALHRYARR